MIINCCHLKEIIHMGNGLCGNIYLAHGIIDRFPRISKGKLYN